MNTDYEVFHPLLWQASAVSLMAQTRGTGTEEPNTLQGDFSSMNISASHPPRTPQLYHAEITFGGCSALKTLTFARGRGNTSRLGRKVELPVSGLESIGGSSSSSQAVFMYQPMVQPTGPTSSVTVSPSYVPYEASVEMGRLLRGHDYGFRVRRDASAKIVSSTYRPSTRV